MRRRIALSAVATLAVAGTAVVAAGCGSSSSADTAASTTARAATATCPQLDGAVSQVVRFANTLEVPVTLSAPGGAECDNSAGQVFSGEGNPSQVDGLRLEPGAEATAVTFSGKAGGRGAFEVGYDVPGGLNSPLPLSVQVRFGGSDGSGTVLGWEEGYEKYVSGPCIDTFRSADGSVRGMVNVQDSAVTFAPRVDSDCR